MEGLIKEIEELETKGLDLGEFIDRFAGAVSSYLDRFSQEKRHEEYQRVVEALRQTPLSERAQTALTYVD